MKKIMLLFTLFLFQNCNTKQDIILSETEIGYEIESIYFQKWIGGQELTGSGIHFYVNFKQELPASVFLKKVYFKNKEAVFNKQSSKNYTAHFYQKPQNQDLILDSDVKKEYGNEGPEIVKPKYNLQENEAILTFEINQKIQNFKFSNIKEKELIAYPSMKPKE